jgi:hypothetical protein
MRRGRKGWDSAIPSDDLGERLDVAVDDLFAGDVGVRGIPRRCIHDDEPVLEVASVEEDNLLGRAVAPARRRVPQRGRRRLRREEPGVRGGGVRRCRREEGGAGGRRRRRGGPRGAERGGARATPRPSGKTLAEDGRGKCGADEAARV